MTVRLLPALLVACVARVLGGCGSGGSQTAHGQTLQDARNVTPLRKQFDADDGHPRLLVLFSR